MVMPVALVFSLKTALAIHSSCGPTQIFRITCSISVKKANVILTALYLQMALGNMQTLTILILSVHEHSISFH